MAQIKYTNTQILDMCGDNLCLDDIKVLILYILSKNKTFEFDTFIKNTIKNKKADRKWRSLYRILYEIPYEDLPLFVSSPKLYKAYAATWRLKYGIS